MTVPPLAPKLPPEPLWKSLARKFLGKSDRGERLLASGRLARTFNNWLKAKDGWLKDYLHRNVVVFDYYDVLTDFGVSDLLRYPTRDGFDSHPSDVGQQRATASFVPFLNGCAPDGLDHGLGPVEASGCHHAMQLACEHPSSDGHARSSLRPVRMAERAPAKPPLPASDGRRAAERPSNRRFQDSDGSILRTTECAERE